MTLRVMHVDDEPDIREVVEMSLHLDPDLTLCSCASGNDALERVDGWSPDLILLDVMMPVMDGPTTLARLRERPHSAVIPVVFMTARAQPRELEHFRSLGAAGVIAKPFDPMSLAVSVRGYLKATRMNGLRQSFLERAREDARALTEQCAALTGPDREQALEAIKATAHGLSGAAGIYGYGALGGKAAALELTVGAALVNGQDETVRAALERLLTAIAES